MKKVFLQNIPLLAAGLTMAAASCTSDNDTVENVIPNEQGLLPVEIRSDINGGRTELDGDGKTVKFQSGDSLAVWDGQGDQEIRRFGTSDSGNVAIFKGNLDPDANVLSILYPLQDGATCTDGTITATIPATQTATENTFDPGANLAVATANYTKGQNVNCTLENVCGLLKFTIASDAAEDSYDSIKIAGKNGEMIAGTVTIKDNAIQSIIPGSDTIILGDATKKLKKDSTYYVVLKPGMFNKGLEMKFYEDNKMAATATITKTGGAGFEVKAGVLLNAGDVKPVPTYTVSFDAGDGSGTMPDTTVNEGNYILPACKLTAPTGKIFAGWSDGTSTYNAGQSISVTSDITLTAKWVIPVFSVSSTTKVKFSPGNLWYNTSENKFYFEENQRDFQPTSQAFWNPNHVSHFYWAQNAAAAYAESFPGSGGDVFFTNDPSDATKPNPDFAVCNGDSTEQGKWRTLSKDEWDHLLNSRTMTNVTFRYTNSTTYRGLFIYPDDYSGLQIGSGGPNTWADINAAGIVFLPRAGDRYEDVASRNAGEHGYYWSSSTYNQYGSLVNIKSDDVELDELFRYFGSCVRLVCSPE